MKAGITSPVLVARIVKPHGIHGEVVLESWTDVEGRLEKTSAFLLIDHGKIIREVKVESRRFIMGRPVFKFVGVTSRTDAEMLRNFELGIPEEKIGKLPPGRFFVFQLLGMDAVLADGQVVGKIQNVVHTGGGDLLELDNGGLIPFNDAICPDVDLGEKRILIDPPEGLIASTRSASSRRRDDS
jgi:16S rRNA processing protein RimM